MCLWKQYLKSHNKQIEWTYRNKYMQNKNLWFCLTTEVKKIELLLKTQQNQSFCFHILWKTDWFSRSNHRIYSKNIKQTKQLQDVYISMTASDNSVINQRMKLIFAIKILKYSFLKFHPKGAINISKNIIFGFTIFN